MTDHNHDDLLEQLAEEYEPELLTLEILSQLNYGGEDYLVAAEYTEEETESTALYFFLIQEENLLPVEDEELLNTLLEIFTILSADDEEE